MRSRSMKLFVEKEQHWREAPSQLDWREDLLLLQMGSFKPINPNRFEGGLDPPLLTCFRALVRWSLVWGVNSAHGGAVAYGFGSDTIYPSTWDGMMTVYKK